MPDDAPRPNLSPLSIPCASSCKSHIRATREGRNPVPGRIAAPAAFTTEVSVSPRTDPPSRMGDVHGMGSSLPLLPTSNAWGSVIPPHPLPTFLVQAPPTPRPDPQTPVRDRGGDRGHQMGSSRCTTSSPPMWGLLGSLGERSRDRSPPIHVFRTSPSPREMPLRIFFHFDLGGNTHNPHSAIRTNLTPLQPKNGQKKLQEQSNAPLPATFSV